MSIFWLKKLKLRGDINTYFVAADGDDDMNDGHSIYAPLKTIPKVNSLSLTAHQQVLFRCGDTFAGQLAPTYRGSEGNWVTYGWYGTGDRPIIDGSAVNSAFYINDDYSYIRVEHLDFSGANDSNSSAIQCYNAHHLYFYDCIGRDALYRHGATVNSNTYHVSHDITMDTCQFYDNHKSGLYSGTLTSYNMLFTHCVSHDNGSALGDHGFYIAGGVITEYCTAYDNYDAGFKQNDNEVESFYYPITRYCISYGNRSGITVTHKNALFHDNLIYSNELNASIFGSAWGNYKLYFNTFVNGTSASTRSIAIDDITPNLEVKNNLFIQDLAVVTKGNLHFDSATYGMDYFASAFDYNTYYCNGSTAAHIIYDTHSAGSELKDWTEWQAAGAEAHGTYLAGLPGFVSRYTDLRPADDGNLVGLGIAVEGYEIDKSGYTRTDPPTPGCYDYPVVAPPAEHIDIDIDLETGDWSQFTSTVIHDGLMTVDAAAALNSTTKGMKIVIDGTDAISYGKKTGLGSEYGFAGVRFYFDPNTITKGITQLYICVLENASAGYQFANISFFYRDGGFRVIPGIIDDAGTGHYSTSVGITDAPHCLEILVQRATSDTSSDGILAFNIDDSLVRTITGIDNYDRMSVFDKAFFGAHGGLTGAVGTFYIDEIKITDNGMIIGG
jgi:hypothetical protein